MASVTTIAPEWIKFYRAVQWGVVWKRPPVEEKLEDPETFIHHGAGGRFGNDHVQAMLDLQKWYHDSKDYSTIAYDIMVHLNKADNTVGIMGARENWLSAATKDRNEQGEAICLMGYFHPGHKLSEHPTDRELEALAFAFAWSIENKWSAADSKLMGHRDNPAHVGATSCPGDFLYPAIGDIYNRAHELLRMAAEADKPKPPPPPPPPPSTDWPLKYEVVSGDNYYAIARKVYVDGDKNTNPAAIQEANGNKALQPGDTLVIPGKATR